MNNALVCQQVSLMKIFGNVKGSPSIPLLLDFLTSHLAHRILIEKKGNNENSGTGEEREDGRMGEGGKSS